jgi:hypothetical protein
MAGERHKKIADRREELNAPVQQETVTMTFNKYMSAEEKQECINEYIQRLNDVCVV